MCGSSVALALAVIFTLLSQVTILVQTCFPSNTFKPTRLTLCNVLILLAATISTTKTFFFGSASSNPIPALQAVGISAQYKDIILLRYHIITAWVLIFSLMISASLDWWIERRISMFHKSQIEDQISNEKE